MEASPIFWNSRDVILGISKCDINFNLSVSPKAYREKGVVHSSPQPVKAEGGMQSSLVSEASSLLTAIGLGISPDLSYFHIA